MSIVHCVTCHISVYIWVEYWECNFIFQVLGGIYEVYIP